MKHNGYLSTTMIYLRRWKEWAEAPTMIIKDVEKNEQCSYNDHHWLMDEIFNLRKLTVESQDLATELIVRTRWMTTE